MNYKDNSVASPGDLVVGTDKDGKPVKGRVVVAHRYFAVAADGKLIGELDSKNLSKAGETAKLVETPAAVVPAVEKKP